MPVTWPGFSAENTLVIPVSKIEFGIQPGPLELAGRLFKPKQEAHITILGSSVGTALRQRIMRDPELEQRIIADFEDTDWSYRTTADYRHLVRSGTGEAGAAVTTEESIIVLLEMKGMLTFYDKLSARGLVDVDLPVPPPHVTLYTHHCDRGIGVHSRTELDALTVEYLDNPEQGVFRRRSKGR